MVPRAVGRFLNLSKFSDKFYTFAERWLMSLSIQLVVIGNGERRVHSLFPSSFHTAPGDS